MEKKQFLDLENLKVIWEEIDKRFLRKNIDWLKFIEHMSDDTINHICDEVFENDSSTNP